METANTAKGTQKSSLTPTNGKKPSSPNVKNHCHGEWQWSGVNRLNLQISR